MATPAPMHIRPACLADADTIADFQIRMARETEGIALDAETVRAGVRAVFDDPAKGAYLVAECDGEIAASLLTTPEWSDWRNATVLWIQSVYVRPECRRRGVYRRMYAALRERIEQDPALAGLRLYVDRLNETARQAYGTLGMDGEHYCLYEWMKD